ncbi:MAG: carbohydrate ABC transporter permease [Aquamicrobium sp.]|jgi:multiple sugar transport system permease protein|uniref:carbohydrate ABC transporter permease n=1 Tax=Mesorhizobium sp. Pch-S TaxID=2082387 RepID=UPI0010135749|nr:carbohydrate ABC transporter permease [Mesorhizobium sp. Pch-S]MBR2688132.1 carbohydrate ABC transporter permease [Aquamicrobium sp.]QAZ45892.1 carbohydrate ABC transporter permease [Mesorhizobium sp. Pch-S]
MIAGRTQSSRFLGGIGLYAAITAYVLFALFPIFWTLKISVTPTSLLYSEGITLWPSRTTFENFSTVLSATDFPRYFLNSVIVSLSTAALVTVIATLAGYAMSRFTFRGKAALAIMLLLTQTFPLVMVIPPIYRMMGQVGLINSLTGLIIIYTAFNTAFATFLMQSFFDGIPKDLEEAAMIDGCTRAQAMRRIIVPLTLPGMGATLGFVFTAAWSELLFALMLISSDDKKTFAVGLLTYIGKFAVDWGQMMAASVLALIPVCIFFGFLQRYLVTGLTAGAVKG